MMKDKKFLKLRNRYLELTKLQLPWLKAHLLSLYCLQFSFALARFIEEEKLEDLKVRQENTALHSSWILLRL